MNQTENINKITTKSGYNFLSIESKKYKEFKDK